MILKKILAIMLIVFVSGCINQTNQNTQEQSIGTNISLDNSVEKIEIYHFHAQRQCYSCITVGSYAEETVNTYFADELESGKIIFGHINVDLPENEELAKKYGATGSSLWIGIYDKNGFHPEQNTNVWYKINNKDDYLQYLKGIIEEKFGEN